MEADGPPSRRRLSTNLWCSFGANPEVPLGNLSVSQCALKLTRRTSLRTPSHVTGEGACGARVTQLVRESGTGHYDPNCRREENREFSQRSAGTPHNNIS
jgi:hypothetical protein